MKAFKKAAGLLLLSYLASADNSSHHVCQHGKHDIAPAIPHYVRSGLEDLDLAAGRSPYTGMPHTVTKSITVTIGPDGKRTVTGGNEDDLSRFFEFGSDGMPHPRGSNFGTRDPFADFHSRDPFGDSNTKTTYSSGSLGGLFSSSPFKSMFGQQDSAPARGEPLYPGSRLQRQPGRGQSSISQKDIDEMENYLKKLRDEQQKQQQPVESDGTDDTEDKKDGTEAKKDGAEDKKDGAEDKKDEGYGDDGDTNGSAAWRKTVEDNIKTNHPTDPASPAKPEEPLKQPENKEGFPFRIVPDYSTILVNSPEHYNYITKELVPAIIDYFTATLRLKYPLKEKITAPNYSNLEDERVCDGGIDRKYVTQGVDGDLLILVRVTNQPSESFTARAASCIEDSRSGRTIISSIKYNLAYVKPTKDEFAHSMNLQTSLHELTHVLGLSGSLYPNFLHPDGTHNRNVLVKSVIGGIQTTSVNVEPLTSRLRKHFNCDKIQGAPLENEGGSGTVGAHLERRIFFNEYMTGSRLFDRKISEFTLALLEGTGWYHVDYNNAEPFYVGKNEGCEYFFGKCTNPKGQPQFPEFCERPGKRQCGGSYNGVAICQPDQFADGCNFPHVREEYDCRNPMAEQIAELLPELQVFGEDAGSKCFMGDLLQKGYSANQETTYCFNYKCNGTGADTTLDIIVGKSVGKCTKKGKISVNGYDGKLECPDPVQFCEVAKPYCPKGCFGRGTCVEGKCHCKAGFKGVDCNHPA